MPNAIAHRIAVGLVAIGATTFLGLHLRDVKQEHHSHWKTYAANVENRLVRLESKVDDQK